MTEETFSDLARNLIMSNVRGVKTQQDTALFGSVSTLSQVAAQQQFPYRIGLWPIICEASPEKGMAIWAALSYLLESWRDVTVYRLPLNLSDKDAETYNLVIGDSQFDIDDWQLDDLTENIAIGGSITSSDANGLELTLAIENDLEEDDEATNLQWHATDWGGLVNQLPDIATNIATRIGADDEGKDRALPWTLNFTSLPESFAQKIFEWEAKLFLHLWDWEWEDEDILDDLSKLVQDANDPATRRIAAYAIARCFLPGFVVVGDLIQEEIPTILADWNYSPEATAIITSAIWSAGYTQMSYDLLSTARIEHPDDIILARAVAAKQIGLNNTASAIATLQEIINKGGSEDRNLYIDYANYLQFALRTGMIDMEKPQVILASDSDELRYEKEAIAAYDRALATMPDAIRERFNQALLLKFVSTDRFWQSFEKILSEDVERRYVIDLIDEMEDMDDISEGVAIAERHINSESDAEHLITLARLYITDYENDKALERLDLAAGKTDDIDLQSEIEKLRLIALNPDFEYKFAETVAKIDAGNPPAEADLDFLEEVVEEAPSYIDAYTALARAYSLNDDDEAAVEVLLDADKAVEAHPDIMDLLSQHFWDTGEKELAFQYLNKGLANAPVYVPLLVRAGQMLFDNDQHDDARQFIARAELISPRDPALEQLKRHIANVLTNNYEDE